MPADVVQHNSQPAGQTVIGPRIGRGDDMKKRNRTNRRPANTIGRSCNIVTLTVLQPRRSLDDRAHQARALSPHRRCGAGATMAKPGVRETNCTRTAIGTATASHTCRCRGGGARHERNEASVNGCEQRGSALHSGRRSRDSRRRVTAVRRGTNGGRDARSERPPGVMIRCSQRTAGSRWPQIRQQVRRT